MTRHSGAPKPPQPLREPPQPDVAALPRAPAPKPNPPAPPAQAELPEELRDLLTVRDGLVAPIPQDPEKQAQRYRDMLAWNQRTLVDAYDRVGSKNALWNAVARRTLDLAARWMSHALDPAVGLDEVHMAAKQAIDAGCDDPLILYVFARSSVAANEAEMDRRHTRAALALRKSAYPAFRRMVGLSRAASHRTTGQDSPKALAEAAELADAAIEFVAVSAIEDEPTPDLHSHWLRTCQSGIAVHRKLTGDSHAAFEHVDKILSKTPALEALRLKLKGVFFIEYAWDARGSGLADTVTEDGWKKFRERLPKAREALERAWKIQPGDAFTAAQMITVVKASTGSREEMETWFERAMTADGNNRDACAAKMDFLDPKWHGSTEELVAFGEMCRATKNWRAGITLLAADAYARLQWQIPAKLRGLYYRHPRVRTPIEAVFEEYLQHFPHAHAQRSEYAVWCYSFGQYTVSHRHFQLAGNNAVRPWWLTEPGFQDIRNRVAGLAQKAPIAPKPSP